MAGSVDLWEVVEETYAGWEKAGRPQVRDFCVTVTPNGQQIHAGPQV